MANKNLTPAGRPVRRFFILPFSLIASLALLTSCGLRTEGMVGLLSGALAWSRQDWVSSTTAFLGSLRLADETGNDRLREYAVYGLASTYLAQDEYSSALNRLASISESAPADVRAGIWYQAGIIAFRKGAFEDASGFFRKSLENDPASLDAKLNLELCRRSLSESRSSQSQAASAVREGEDTGTDNEAIFNLIRKKEQDRWKNQTDGESDRTVADY